MSLGLSGSRNVTERGTLAYREQLTGVRVSIIVRWVKAWTRRLAQASVAVAIGAVVFIAEDVLPHPLGGYVIFAALVLSAYVVRACATYAVRRFGGNNFAIGLISALSVAYVVALGGRLSFALPSATGVVLLIIGTTCFVLVAAAWFAPHLAVAVTGGPSATWSLLWERARIYFENLEAPDNETGAEREAFELRLRALDRYRNARTNEFIDLFQEFYRKYDAELPPEVAPAWMDRFRSLELRLFRALGAPPAWYRDFPWLSHSAQTFAGQDPE